MPLGSQKTSWAPMPDTSSGFSQEDVSFSVLADTNPGVEVRVVGSIPALGSWQPKYALALSTTDTTYPTWSTDVRLPTSLLSKTIVEYKFVMVHPDGAIVWEGRPNRQLFLVGDAHSLTQTAAPRFGEDCQEEPATLATAGMPSAGKECGETPSSFSNEAVVSKAETLFKVACNKTDIGDAVVVVGECEALGCWNPARGLRLETSPTLFPYWSASVCLPVEQDIQWKLIIAHASGDFEWENAQNRKIKLDSEIVGEQGSCCTVQAKYDQSGITVEPPLQRCSTQKSSMNPTGLQASGVRSLTKSEPRAQPAGACHSRRRRASVSYPNIYGNSEMLTVGLPVERQNTLDGDEHLLVLRLRDIEPEVNGANTLVEVVFETDNSKKKLEYDCHKEHWSIATLDAALQPGMHLFHFLIDGKHRALSSEHVVLGTSNAVLICDSVRRYIQAHLAMGLDPERNTSSDIDIDNEKRISKLARPYSIGNHLSALCEYDDDNTEVSINMGEVPIFKKEVFDGLFDSELKIRLDGLASCVATPQVGPKSFKFWPGAHVLKKEKGACEDAYFIDEYGMGVADGVGCMVQFASYGVNAAAYATELMEHVATALGPNGIASTENTLYTLTEGRAKAAAIHAEKRALTYGASTLTVAVCNENTIGISNLGDSGAMLLRKGPHGMFVVARSEEQQHSWNCPYQLTRLPPILAARFPKLVFDSAADSSTYRFSVCEDDLFLMYTDGLTDNLHEREILQIVDRILPPTFAKLVGLPEGSTTPDRIARALALAAHERSIDQTAKVPFAEYSKKHGFECIGGKQDDITVVAAWVVRDGDVPGLQAMYATPQDEHSVSPRSEHVYFEEREENNETQDHRHVSSKTLCAAIDQPECEEISKSYDDHTPVCELQSSDSPEFISESLQQAPQSENSKSEESQSLAALSEQVTHDAEFMQNTVSSEGDPHENALENYVSADASVCEQVPPVEIYQPHIQQALVCEVPVGSLQQGDMNNMSKLNTSTGFHVTLSRPATPRYETSKRLSEGAQQLPGFRGPWDPAGQSRTKYRPISRHMARSNSRCKSS